jgi:hypothetical protein
MLRRFFRLATIAAALFLIYFGMNAGSLYERVRLDRSFPALSRYAFERTPRIAIVGSSMSFRIYEGYFDTPLRNLSIGGGSSATGLAIISGFRPVPPIIIVETNILSRPVDQNLVEAFGDNPSEPYKWFRPARAAISWIYYWIKYQPQHEMAQRLLASPATTYDISENVAATIAEYKGKDWQAIMRPNVEALERLVSDLERRGARIFLLEMPSPPELRANEYVVTASKLARQVFPNPKQWIEVMDSDLRWVDASHLDERSAALVAHQLDSQLTRMLRDCGSACWR